MRNIFVGACTKANDGNESIKHLMITPLQCGPFANVHFFLPSLGHLRA